LRARCCLVCRLLGGFSFRNWRPPPVLEALRSSRARCGDAQGCQGKSYFTHEAHERNTRSNQLASNTTLSGKFGSTLITFARKQGNKRLVRRRPFICGRYFGHDVSMLGLAEIERELKNARQEVRNLQVLQMRPGLSAEKLETLRNLARSARAEVKLRLKALEYARRKS
jgi:hypothetical protein